MTTAVNAVAETDKKLAVLTKRLDGLMDKLSKQPDPNQPTPDQVFGAPWARRGEDSMSSRGFSFYKMFGVLTGALQKDQAKTELDVADRLHQVYVKDLGTGGYLYGGAGMRFLAPLSTSFMQENVVPASFRHEMKSLVAAGVGAADPDEMQWIRRKMMGAYGRKDLSWLNDQTGGALVAPPEMGELIELLRNKEALVNAGARTVPLPPQGRIKYPRQTAASTTYWVGENQGVPDSNIGTGDVTLQAKKLAVLIKAPNELIRYASPAAEALLRDDMTKSLALGLDLAGLEGAGGDTRPRGLLNMPDINVITSSDVRPNGDVLVGRDAYRMVAAVEESNAEFESWIMRPKTWMRWYSLRGDAVAAGDQAGLFLFNPTREIGSDGGKPTLAGYPVVKSTQVSQVRTKGSSSSLTYILGGMFSDLLIGMFGAIEFAATTQGDTAFQNDQTWVRGILSADIAARHAAAFCLLDSLDVTV